MRYVPTTRNDGTIDFMPSGSSCLSYRVLP
jgi:hypothetical protein